MIDEPLSAALRVRVRAAPHDCYFNAERALPLAPPGTRYVLGTYGELRNPHAWLEAPDGSILEVTPHLRWPAAETYAAHHRLTPREVVAWRSAGNCWPPIEWWAPLWTDEELAALKTIVPPSSDSRA